MLTAALPLALAGCQDAQPTAKPLTHDGTGRAVVSTEQAVAYFTNFCYATSNNRSRVRAAVSRDGNMVSESKKIGDVSGFFSKHKTLSVDVISADTLGCGVNVVTAEDSAQGAAKITVAMLAKYSVSGINGRENGGKLSLKTPKGSILIVNRKKTEKNSILITLYPNK